jgi:hypothetical protein
MAAERVCLGVGAQYLPEVSEMHVFQDGLVAAEDGGWAIFSDFEAVAGGRMS